MKQMQNLLWRAECGGSGVERRKVLPNRKIGRMREHVKERVSSQPCQMLGLGLLGCEGNTHHGLGEKVL
jgi:hypothetical protein